MYVVVGCFVMAVAGVASAARGRRLSCFPGITLTFPDRTRHEPIEVLWSFACEGFTTNPRNSGRIVRPGNYYYQTLKYLVPQQI